MQRQAPETVASKQQACVMMTLRMLSAAGVAAFGACDVLLRLHELPLVCARLTCGGDHDTWVCVASFVLCARAAHAGDCRR